MVTKARQLKTGILLSLLGTKPPYKKMVRNKYFLTYSRVAGNRNSFSMVFSQNQVAISIFFSNSEATAPNQQIPHISLNITGESFFHFFCLHCYFSGEGT